jgi:ubiquinone biosynthesis protein UbiJ
VLTEAVENLLNRNLGASPRARELCAELKYRRVTVIADGTPWRITVESLGTSLQLSGQADREVDAELAGSPVNLLALTGPTPEGVIQRGAVRIRGDAELVQRYRDLLALLQPDFEEELSRLLGDSTAHRLFQAASRVLGLGRRVATTGVRNTAEYFAHESGDLVPTGEARQFLVGVDRLREDVDRFGARLAQLEAAIRGEPALPEDPR